MKQSHVHIDWAAVFATDDPDSTLASVRVEIDGCPRCIEAHAQAERLLAGLRDARLPQPPVALVRDVLPQVLSLARERSPRPAAETPVDRADRATPPEGVGSPWAARIAHVAREIAARLVGDSLTPTHALRGGASGPRVLRYDAGAYAVSISLVEAKDGVNLRGQLTPTSDIELPETRRALLHVSGSDATKDLFLDSEVTEFGEFRFDAVPLGADPERGLRVSVLAGEEIIQVDVKE